MRVYETTIFEGEPYEIHQIQTGEIPSRAMPLETKLAMEMLVKRTDDLSKALDILLGDKNGKGKK